MIPRAPLAGIGAAAREPRAPIACPVGVVGRPAANPLVFRGKIATGGEFPWTCLTWGKAGSMMVLGASARRPELSEPRAAESHSSVVLQGRVAGALAPARPEVSRGRRAQPIATFAHRGDLRPCAPRPEGGLLTTALRIPAPVARQTDALDRACLCARIAADNKGR